MDKITNYQVIVADSPSLLEEKVKDQMNEGWEPYHGPLMIHTASGPRLAQAMVIYKRGGPA